MKNVCEVMAVDKWKEQTLWKTEKGSQGNFLKIKKGFEMLVQ